MGQFLFAMVGTAGNHGTEMDSKTNSNLDSMPRSHPAFYSMTIIAGGAGSQGPTDAVMRLREGTGGKFGNLLLSNLGGTHKGIEIKDCGSQSIVQTMPSAGTSIDTYLYVSPQVAIGGAPTGSGITIASGCSATPASFSFVNSDLLPSSGSISETGSDTVDPRPECSSGAYSNIDAVPSSSFFTTVGFKGAFGNTAWLDGWSYLDQNVTGSRIPSTDKGCGSNGDIDPPVPPTLSCGEGTAASSSTGLCEITCDSSSGRRLEDDMQLGEPITEDYIFSLPKDENHTVAADIVAGYLGKHPELEARLGQIDHDILVHLEKLGQLFGQPALA